MRPFLILIFVALFCSCEINSENEIKFQGITITDANGENIGYIDPSDWTFDRNWSQNEINLFDQHKDKFKSEKLDTTIKIQPAYPNPTPLYFNFTYTQDYVSSSTNKNVIQEGITVVYRIVNQHFERLISDEYLSNETGGYLYVFSSENYGLNKNEIFRLYYAFFYHDTCIYKGHGDILMSETTIH